MTLILIQIHQTVLENESGKTIPESNSIRQRAGSRWCFNSWASRLSLPSFDLAVSRYLNSGKKGAKCLQSR